MEREAEQLRAPDGAGRAVARHVDRLLPRSLIDEEAHALSRDPGVGRRALGERGERVEEEGARLMHALADGRVERAIAVDALVRLLSFFGRIPVGAHRAPTAMVNHAWQIGVRGAALEAAVPVTVDVTQADVVIAVAAELRPGVPGASPHGDEADDGIIGGLEDRAGCLRLGDFRRGSNGARRRNGWLQTRSGLQEQGERELGPHNRSGCDRLTLAVCNRLSIVDRRLSDAARYARALTSRTNATRSLR